VCFLRTKPYKAIGVVASCIFLCFSTHPNVTVSVSCHLGIIKARLPIIEEYISLTGFSVAGCNELSRNPVYRDTLNSIVVVRF
jgi:hypothetical protein